MKKIQEQIKNRDFAKVYLLYGEEEYLKRYYKKQLVQAVLKDTDQMNYSAYEGKAFLFVRSLMWRKLCHFLQINELF